MAKQLGSAWTHRDGRPGRLGVLFACMWLAFLVAPLQAAWQRLDGVDGWVGMVSVLAFAATYVVCFAVIRQRRMRIDDRRSSAALLFLGTLAVLALVICVTVGQAGTSTFVYIAVVAVMWLPGRFALATVTLVAITSDLAGRLVPGWDVEAGLTFAVCTAAFAMWGVNQLMLRNLDLVRARDENARLAVVAERNRFARDLHDILGHSLTVITVKAELAQRLLDVDPERARASSWRDLERAQSRRPARRTGDCAGGLRETSRCPGRSFGGPTGPAHAAGDRPP